MYKVKERDWKVFRKKVPGWQEKYMEKLIREYIELLEQDKDASEKFWTLDKQIKKDKRKSGVLIEEMSRSSMTTHILNLLHDGAITLADLEDFSDEVRNYFEQIMSQ